MKKKILSKNIIKAVTDIGFGATLVDLVDKDRKEKKKQFKRKKYT